MNYERQKLKDLFLRKTSKNIFMPLINMDGAPRSESEANS